MLNNDPNTIQAGSAYTSSTTVDAGLRAYMIRIYNYVAAGLALSGAVAYTIFSVPALQPLLLNPIVMIIGFIFMIVMCFKISPQNLMQNSLASGQAKYFAFCAIMGISLTTALLVYTGTSVVKVFFITAAMFGGTSLLAYTTKRDLSRWGSFLLVGLVGLIIASLVNLFFKSPAAEFAISVIGVLLFTGLIAYDTQMAKRLYSGNEETDNKMAIFSAFGLYINLINLFQFLLSLFGNRN